MNEVLALLVGFAGGVVSGLFGVGGGILFVPALSLLLGLSQVEAISSSLLAIIPVAIIGTWRQYRYNNVKIKSGLLIGFLAIPVIIAATAVANTVGNRALEVGFACLLIYMAVHLVRKSTKRSSDS